MSGKKNNTPVLEDEPHYAISSLGGSLLGSSAAKQGRQCEETAIRIGVKPPKENPNTAGTVNALDLLIGSGTVQEEKKSFFKRLFKK